METALSDSDRENHWVTEHSLRQASVDRMTGAYSNTYFNIQLDRAFERSTANGTSLSLMMFSLDGLDADVNVHEQEAGEFILRRSIQRIKSKGVSNKDILGRRDHNLFSLLLERVTLQQATKIGKRLVGLFNDTPLPYHDQLFLTSLSIGITAVDTTTTDPESLIKQACSALSLSLSLGGNGSCVFQSSTFNGTETDTLTADANHLI